MDNNGEVVYLYLDDIIPNRFQPREVFDDQALKELAVSIREHGVIQPIIVRKVENKYEIIAGERRYKASTMAGLTKIPAIVKNLDDKESSKVALIENLQRKDLSPIEEARTYQKILELDDMTQEQLAATIGKTQSSVSNKLRLLDLPEEIQEALLKEKISERHARSLLSIEDKNDQIKMMDKVIAEKMTVRELDKEIKEMKEGPIEESNDSPKETFTIVNPPKEEDNNQNVSINLEENKEVEGETKEMNIQEQNVNVEITTPSNPTSIDINKIRETAVDINPQTTPPQNNEGQNDNGVKEFKFVPSFGTTDNNSATEVTSAPTNVSNAFDNLFSTNTTKPQEDNNNVSSAILTPGISVPSATPVLDISQATTDVKNVINDLKGKGFNITYVESDDSDSYKINIQINKN